MTAHLRLRVLALAATLTLPAVPAVRAAAVDDAAIRRCRQLPDTAARLACYDSLPVAVEAPVPAQPPPRALPAVAAPVGVVAATGATAVAASTASAAPAASTASSASASASASAPPPASRFGLEAPRPEPSAISTRIEGVFEGWGPRTRFKLANGQVWQVTDDSSAAYNLLNPQVTVRRAAFGSFVLEIEGANRTPRVRRVE